MEVSNAHTHTLTAVPNQLMYTGEMVKNGVIHAANNTHAESTQQSLFKLVENSKIIIIKY